MEPSFVAEIEQWAFARLPDPGVNVHEAIRLPPPAPLSSLQPSPPIVSERLGIDATSHNAFITEDIYRKFSRASAFIEAAKEKQRRQREVFASFSFPYFNRIMIMILGK